MIRVLITTTSSWAPIVHGSAHGGPDYAQNLLHAKVTDKLGVEIPVLFASNHERLGLPSTMSIELTRVRYAETAPLDRYAADIEIEITLGTELSVEKFRQFRSLIFGQISHLLRHHSVTTKPSITLHIDQVRNFGYRRSPDGRVHSWECGDLLPITQAPP